MKSTCQLKFYFFSSFNLNFILMYRFRSIINRIVHTRNSLLYWHEKCECFKIKKQYIQVTLGPHSALDDFVGLYNVLTLKQMIYCNTICSKHAFHYVYPFVVLLFLRGKRKKCVPAASVITHL